MGKVLDKLKTDLEAIVDSPELIRNEKHMMGLLTKWEAELPEFKEYHHDFIENIKPFYFNAPGKAKAQPTKELMRELISPEDQDNKACTPVLEEISAVMARTWIAELVDTTKTTWPLLSESGGKYSWKGSSEELNARYLGVYLERQ